jgi:DNA-binding HxlR family transcriptional regulator
MGSSAVRTGKIDVPYPKPPGQCPVEDWLTFLGHRWNALALWHLRDSAKRNSELAAVLPGISPKVLSERLEGLEKRGLIARLPLATFPRGVAYRLTERGESLLQVLDGLQLWAEGS